MFSIHAKAVRLLAEIESHQHALDADRLIESSQLSAGLQDQKDTFGRIMKKAIEDATSFHGARLALIKSDAQLRSFVGGSKSYAGLRISDILVDSGKLHSTRSGGVKTMCEESKAKVIAAATTDGSRGEQQMCGDLRCGDLVACGDLRSGERRRNVLCMRSPRTQ